MIYVIHADLARCQTFVLDAKEVRRKLGADSRFHFDQRPAAYAPGWQPLHIAFARPAGAKGTALPELSLRHGRLYLSDRAHGALAGLLQGSGEFLPVTHDGGGGYLFNVLALAESVDGLDARLSTRNEFGEVQSLAFHDERVAGLPVFRTAFDHYLGVFCGEAFRAACEAAALTGVVFESDLVSLPPSGTAAGRPAAH